MQQESPLSLAQFRAAQMLMARLLAECEGRDFEFEEVGAMWLGSDEITCAICEDGTEISVTDLIYASLVLLWSSIIERADVAGESILDVLARLGIGVAQNEPT